MLNLSIPGFGPEALVLGAIPEGALVTAGASGSAGAGLSGISFFTPSAAAFSAGELAGLNAIDEAYAGYSPFNEAASQSFIGGDYYNAGGSFFPSNAPLANNPSFFSGLGAKDALIGLQAAGALAGLAGAALQGSMKMPGGAPLPAQKSPAEMPDPESMAVKIKAKRDAAIISQKYGRQSTFLTDSDETRLG